MAVHSAAIAGHGDIVRIILEADNMVDLNTPTFHTKETLAHLAVKHGHRSLYNMLVAFGADLSIKDGNGKRICDVTDDREWRREIAAFIVEIERNQAACEGARNQRQRELENATASTTIESTTKNSKKKRKGKKGKKGEKRTPPTSVVFTPGAANDDVVEVTNLLTALLVADGSVAETSNVSGRSLLESSLKNAAATFARLRDPNIPAADKADVVKCVCKLIEKLESLVEASSHPSRLNSTDWRVRIAIASEALQVTHMMHKFYRVDHAAIAVPALAPVRELCDTTMAFTKFVVGTAQLSVSVDRKPQAREVLGVLEKRLVKTPFAKREPGEFRELVQAYSSAREGMGLGQMSGPDTFHALEWYLSSIADRFKVQTALDKFVGRPMYLELSPILAITPRQFSRFEAAVDVVPDLDGVVCFDRRVLYGATTFDDLMRVLGAVKDLTGRKAMYFAQESVQIAVTRMRVGQFVISEDGVVRSTA
ncbi:hypothetical protein ON010_g7670 [Phytophthora cinnamomi]|nr:hypothetical protein ON010_g7670 [Phytophthora cinnamomi]